MRAISAAHNVHVKHSAYVYNYIVHTYFFSSNKSYIYSRLQVVCTMCIVQVRHTRVCDETFPWFCAKNYRSLDSAKSRVVVRSTLHLQHLLPFPWFCAKKLSKLEFGKITRSSPKYPPSTAFITNFANVSQRWTIQLHTYTFVGTCNENVLFPF